MDAENREELVTLYDEDGNEVQFEHLDTFELNDNVYVALLEQLEDGEESDEVLILRVEPGETEEEESLAVIEDDDELQAAFEEFTFRMDDAFEFDDDDEEE